MHNNIMETWKRFCLNKTCVVILGLNQMISQLKYFIFQCIFFYLTKHHENKNLETDISRIQISMRMNQIDNADLVKHNSK